MAHFPPQLFLLCPGTYATWGLDPFPLSAPGPLHILSLGAHVFGLRDFSQLCSGLLSKVLGGPLGAGDQTCLSLCPGAHRDARVRWGLRVTSPAQAALPGSFQ